MANEKDPILEVYNRYIIQELRGIDVRNPHGVNTDMWEAIKSYVANVQKREAVKAKAQKVIDRLAEMKYPYSEGSNLDSVPAEEFEKVKAGDYCPFCGVEAGRDEDCKSILLCACKKIVQCDDCLCYFDKGSFPTVCPNCKK